MEGDNNGDEEGVDGILELSVPDVPAELSTLTYHNSAILNPRGVYLGSLILIG